MAENTPTRFLSQDGLVHYTGRLKEYIDNQDSALDSKIKSEIDKVKGTVNTLTSDLATVNDTIDKHSESITTITDILKDAAGELSDSKNAIKSLETVVNGVDSKVDEVTNTVTELSGTVEEQKTALEELAEEVETQIEAAVKEAVESVQNEGLQSLSFIKVNLAPVPYETVAEGDDEPGDEVEETTLISYNGKDPVKIKAEFVENGTDIDFQINGHTWASFDTAKFTKDAMVNSVVFDEDTNNLVFTFNLAGNEGGHDVISVPITSFFDGKAKNVSLELGATIDNGYVNIPATADVETAIVSLAVGGKTLKDKVDNLPVYEALTPNEIDALLADEWPEVWGPI